METIAWKSLHLGTDLNINRSTSIVHQVRVNEANDEVFIYPEQSILAALVHDVKVDSEM